MYGPVLTHGPLLVPRRSLRHVFTFTRALHALFSQHRTIAKEPGWQTYASSASMAPGHPGLGGGAYANAASIAPYGAPSTSNANITSYAMILWQPDKQWYSMYLLMTWLPTSSQNPYRTISTGNSRRPWVFASTRVGVSEMLSNASPYVLFLVRTIT